jgi:hypothetical protein
MSKRKLTDTRSLGRKLLAGALAVVLAIAVPIARCTGCGDVNNVSTNEKREPSFDSGTYVGDAPPRWASMSEGLRYLPVEIVKNLKRPSSTEKLKLIDEPLFAKPERFGMVPNPMDSQFPIGITKSNDGDEFVPMLGITCGACHVGAVSNGREWTIVPGAPNLMTVNLFFGELIGSLAATLANPVAFDDLWKSYASSMNYRYDQSTMTETIIDEDDINGIYDGIITDRVLKLSNAYKNGAYPTKFDINTRGKLGAYLTLRLVELIGRANAPDDGVQLPLGTSNPWATTRSLFGTKWAHDDPANLTPVGGAITAPDIFNYGERRWVFWSQATNSMMERNLAQGIALLGDVDWDTFQTTLSTKDLAAIEEASQFIEPPTWPRIFNDVDRSLASEGCKVFEKRCKGCHVGSSRSFERGSVEFGLYDVGTDPSYCEGVNASTLDYTSVPALVAPVAARVKSVAYDVEGRLDESGRTPVIWRAMECNKFPARSLEGIWATGPFLHNGSVRTINDLLKPANEREKHFEVGSIELDQTKLGFRGDKTSSFTTTVDVTIHGMSNMGHEFTVSDPSQRFALLEYLKIHHDTITCGESDEH